MRKMKRLPAAFCALLAAMLACIPGQASIKDAKVTVTTFVDEGGSGIPSDPPPPLPDTLVIAMWNVHGGMYREVKLTDQDGLADFSVGYTHYFDIIAVPPCGYHSTTPLYLDMTKTDGTAFGFWPNEGGDGRPSRVRLMVWRDRNSNKVRDAGEEITDKQASIMFDVPHGSPGNVFDQDNYLQEAPDGWFDIELGNSCGRIFALLLDSELVTVSVSEPGGVSDAGSHGNTYYPAIEIPYSQGETTVYWEIK